MNTLIHKTMMICAVLFLVATLAFAGGQGEGAAVGAEEETWTMKLSHGDAISDNPTHQAALKFKELVEDYTDGRVTVEIFANNALGSEQEVAQAVRQGNIEAEILATSNLQPFAPSMGVLQLPYVFSSHEEAWVTMDAALPALRERVIDEAGVRIVSLFEKGFRVMSNSVREVTRLEHLRGLKIRTPRSVVPIETFRSWGIDPVPMAWDEVFSALQQGVIDGQENPYTTLVTSKFYEVQDYVTEIHYTIWTGPLIVSERWYQDLPAEMQDAITRAGVEAADFERQYSTNMIGDTKEALVNEYGMTLSGPPTDEDEWQERAMAIWPELAPDLGGEDWVEEFLRIREEAIGSIQ